MRTLCRLYWYQGSLTVDDIEDLRQRVKKQGNADAEKSHKAPHTQLVEMMSELLKSSSGHKTRGGVRWKRAATTGAHRRRSRGIDCASRLTELSVGGGGKPGGSVGGGVELFGRCIPERGSDICRGQRPRLYLCWTHDTYHFLPFV